MPSFTRRSGRPYDQMRKVEVDLDYLPYAEGSCLIKFGNTHVVCSATLDQQLPHRLRNTGHGWITAEYGMLPRSTSTRMQRESSKGRVDGRTHEIQRLIARSLRSIVDMRALGERQILIDCDVIKADGGTRTAAITGGYIALFQALHKLKGKGAIKTFPLNMQVAAISCGIVQGTPVLDLEYIEDSQAEVDANFILSGDGRIVEIQATGEKRPFSEDEYVQLLGLAKKGVSELLKIQNQMLLKYA